MVISFELRVAMFKEGSKGKVMVKDRKIFSYTSDDRKAIDIQIRVMTDEEFRFSSIDNSKRSPRMRFDREVFSRINSFIYNEIKALSQES
jgi:hypothetical protein